MENTSLQPSIFPERQKPSSLSSASRWLDGALKRFADICGSLFGLLLLAPLFLYIAWRIRRDSTGPVFYWGTRLGRGGKPFQILKFRSMYENPESYAGPRLTSPDDPRITPLGHWLRDTKLNELPQLWNVLLGEMSFVGPRPEDPSLAQSWTGEERKEILSVRPGITSPASVLYRDEETLLSSRSQGTGGTMDSYLRSILPSKARLDQLYVRNRSIFLDLDTLLWTGLTLMPKLGPITPPEDHLFLGPITRLMRRHVSWFMIDTLVTLAAIGFTGLFFRSLGPLNVGLPKAFGVAVVFSLIYSLSNAALGVNRTRWAQAGFSDALDLIPAVGLATLAVLAMNLAWQPNPLLPAEMILTSAVFAALGFVLVRYRSRLLSEVAVRWLSVWGVRRAQERILIIGGGESGRFVSWWLQSSSAGNAFRILGYVDDDPFIQDARIHRVNVIGQTADIPALVKQYDAGVIFFAIHNIPEEEKQRLLKICQSTGARVVSIPDVLGNLREAIHDAGPGAGKPGKAGEQAS